MNIYVHIIAYLKKYGAGTRSPSRVNRGTFVFGQRTIAVKDLLSLVNSVRVCRSGDDRSSVLNAPPQQLLGLVPLVSMYAWERTILCS